MVRETGVFSGLDWVIVSEFFSIPPRKNGEKTRRTIVIRIFFMP